MAVTAETFEPKHFDKLARGIEIAKEALESRESELNDLRNEVGRQEQMLAELPSWDQWNRLVERIEDVERGVYTLDDLLTYVKEMR